MGLAISIANPIETWAGFSDTAEMTSEMTVEEPEDPPGTAPFLMAHSGDSAQMLVVQGRNSRILEGTTWQNPSYEVPTPLTMLGFCNGHYLGTNGTAWYRLDLSEGWSPISNIPPFGRTTVFSGAVFCTATDGADWKFSFYSEGWSTMPGPAEARAIGAHMLGTLVATSTEFQATSDFGETWEKPSGLPTPPAGPVLLGAIWFVYADGDWYHNTDPYKPYGPWEPDPVLQEAALENPLAMDADIDADDNERLLVTDGITWQSISGGQVTVLDPPW